jgi:L-asparaginase
VLFTTGGTIASTLDPATGGVVPAVRAADLLAAVPALAGVADVAVTEFCMEASWNLGADTVAALARAVHDATRDPSVAGVVVTHGTDTMEETAFALDLLLEHAAPVVLTGAMRDASSPGADGPRNLFAAASVAVATAARGLGALVVMNDEVHAARAVSKTHSTALGAFASPGAGPIGVVDGVGVRISARLPRPPRLPRVDPSPGVYLVKSAAGMDDLLLRALGAGGARGVVVEGSGAGNVPGAWEPALGALIAAGIPVVLSTRCGAGRVTPTYASPGGGRRLRALGVIPAGALPGPKARVALMFALGAGLAGDALREFFAHFDG